MFTTLAYDPLTTPRNERSQPPAGIAGVRPPAAEQPKRRVNSPPPPKPPQRRAINSIGSPDPDPPR